MTDNCASLFWPTTAQAAALFASTGLSIWAAEIARTRRGVPGGIAFGWMMLAVALWRTLGPGAAFWVATPFALGLLVLFFTDWDHQLLPDPVTLGGFASGLALAWWNPFLSPEPGAERLWSALSGAALGAGVLWAIGAAYTRLRGIEAMGMGDVKMMAMVGAFAGPSGSGRAPQGAA